MSVCEDAWLSWWWCVDVEKATTWFRRKKIAARAFDYVTHMGHSC